MSKVVRYTTVGAPRSAIVHRTTQRLVEGNRTVCGRYMETTWSWWRTRPLPSQRCKQCYR